MKNKGGTTAQVDKLRRPKGPTDGAEVRRVSVPHVRHNTDLAGLGDLRGLLTSAYAQRFAHPLQIVRASINSRLLREDCVRPTQGDFLRISFNARRASLRIQSFG